MIKCPTDIIDCNDCDFGRTVSWCAQQYDKPKNLGKNYKYYMEGFWKGYGSAHEEYKILDKALEEKLQNYEWTSVDQELPPEQEQVIVSILDDHGDSPYRYTTAGWRVDSIWIVENEVNPYVVAWRFFPEPYKEY